MWVCLDPRVILVLGEVLDLLEILVSQEPKELRVQLDLQALQAQSVLLVLEAILESLDNQVLLEILDLLDLLARQEQRALQVHRAFQVLREQLEPLEHLDQPVSLDHPVIKV